MKKENRSHFQGLTSLLIEGKRFGTIVQSSLVYFNTLKTTTKVFLVMRTDEGKRYEDLIEPIKKNIIDILNDSEFNESECEQTGLDSS